MPGLTAALGAMVSSLSYEQPPAEVAVTAKLGITDCTAAMLAGRDQPVSRLMADMVEPQSSGEARLLFERLQGLEQQAGTKGLYELGANGG